MPLDRFPAEWFHRRVRRATRLTSGGGAGLCIGSGLGHHATGREAVDQAAEAVVLERLEQERDLEDLLQVVLRGCGPRWEHMRDQRTRRATDREQVGIVAVPSNGAASAGRPRRPP